jgi:hypothetical protein
MSRIRIYDFFLPALTTPALFCTRWKSFKPLSNNFPAKKKFFYMLLYRQYAVNFQKKNAFCSKQFVKHFTARIWSDISQSINLQKCTQIADILPLFLLHKYLLPKSKKVSKSVKMPVHL